MPQYNRQSLTLTIYQYTTIEFNSIMQSINQSINQVSQSNKHAIDEVVSLDSRTTELWQPAALVSIDSINRSSSV